MALLQPLLGTFDSGFFLLRCAQHPYRGQRLHSLRVTRDINGLQPSPESFCAYGTPKLHILGHLDQITKNFTHLTVEAPTQALCVFRLRITFSAHLVQDWLSSHYVEQSAFP